MMSPPMPCAAITRTASRETRNDPRAITSCWMSQSAAVVSVSGLEMDSPALLTTRATPPCAPPAPPAEGRPGPGPRRRPLLLVGHIRGERHRHVVVPDLGRYRLGPAGV